MFARPPTLNLLSFKQKTKQNWQTKSQLRPFVFAVFTRGHERSRSKQRHNYRDGVIVCVVSQQGRVRRDFWERRGKGRVLGPAKLTGTVATSASVCVTASVVSAVWLQVTICMHVCPQLSLWTPLWAQSLKVFVCGYTQLCQHTSVCVCVCVCVCVFSLANKIKALVMHKIRAQNAAYVSAEHKLFIMLVHCKRGHGSSLVIQPH